MPEDAKRIALRMIPYGLYVLTAESEGGAVAAATINWVTQASFAPPLVAVGVKADSGAHEIIKETGVFALNVLGKDQQDIAFTFFKPAEPGEGTLSGQPIEKSPGGLPLLVNAPAWVECKIAGTVGGGDHTIFVGEVTAAGVRKEPEGRADDATLWLKDLGDTVYYGG